MIPHRDLMEDNTLLSSISYRLVRVCCEFKDKHKQIMKTEKKIKTEVLYQEASLVVN